MSDELDQNEAKISAAAGRLGIRLEGETAVFDGKSLLASLGGWTGVVESTIPPTAFLVIYTVAQNTFWSVAISGALSLASIAKQLIQRKPVAQALVGAALIAISAWLALRSPGATKDYFVPGFVTNVAYGSVMLLSILVRWPVIGVIVGFFKGWGVSWRKNRSQLNRFDLVTGMWAAMFGLRLAVELPLYFANQVEALGLTKLFLSTPLYAICVWFTWLSLRSVILTKP